jgi:hypothetical protein
MIPFNESLRVEFSNTSAWTRLAGLQGKAVVWKGKVARVHLDESHSTSGGPSYVAELIFDDLARTMTPTHDFDEVLATLPFSA